MGKVKTPKARQLNYAYWVNTEGIRGKEEEMRSRKGWIGGANFRVDVLCQPMARL